MKALMTCTIAALTSSAGAQTTLDFEGLASAGDQINGAPPAETVLTDDFRGVGILFGGASSAGVAVVDRVGSFVPSSGVNSIVGLDANGNIPNAASGDIYFSFVLPGTDTDAVAGNVSFTLGDVGGDLDTFVIRALSASGDVLETQNVAGESRFLVSLSSSSIASVEVLFDPDNVAGYSLDDLSFTVVPAPGTAAMLGLGALLTGRRRR